MEIKDEKINLTYARNIKRGTKWLHSGLGGSYNIDFADKDVVQVNYDASVINYPHMLGEVRAHCASYGKGYENDSTITNGWGITMAVYRCKGSPEPNVTPKKIKVK